MCNTCTAIPLTGILCAGPAIFPQKVDFELASFEMEVEENMGKTIMINCKVISLYLYPFEVWQATLKVCLPLHKICQRKLHLLSQLAAAFYLIGLALMHNELLTHRMSRLGVIGFIYLKHLSWLI